MHRSTSNIESNAREHLLSRSEIFTEIEKAIIKLFGTSGAYVVLHKVGMEVGVATYERCTPLSDVEDKGKILSCFLRRECMADWSEVKFIPRNGTVRTVRINHSLEACVGRAFKKAASHTCCYPFLRGYLEGFLSSWHGKSIKVEPSNCVIARGKFCELQVKQTQDNPSRKQQD